MRKILCPSKRGHQLGTVRVAGGRIYVKPTSVSVVGEDERLRSTVQRGAEVAPEFEWSVDGLLDVFACSHGEFRLPEDLAAQLEKPGSVVIARRL